MNFIVSHYISLILPREQFEFIGEVAKHWPFQNDVPDSSNIAPTVSKTSVQSSIRDDNKTNITSVDNDISHKTSSYLRTNHLTSSNSFVSNKKKLESRDKILPITSDFSLNDLQKRPAWNLKAQEGVIRYQLPDNLPDSFALQNKLQKLMKTNSIYLNDRRFWTKLENRFKNLRKVLNFFRSKKSFFHHKIS